MTQTGFFATETTTYREIIERLLEQQREERERDEEYLMDAFGVAPDFDPDADEADRDGTLDEALPDAWLDAPL